MSNVLWSLQSNRSNNDPTLPPKLTAVVRMERSWGHLKLCLLFPLLDMVWEELPVRWLRRRPTPSWETDAFWVKTKQNTVLLPGFARPFHLYCWSFLPLVIAPKSEEVRLTSYTLKEMWVWTVELWHMLGNSDLEAVHTFSIFMEILLFLVV